MKRDFEIERQALIEEIDVLLLRSNNNVLLSLKNILLLQNQRKNINGTLTRLVIDALDSRFKILGEKILAFENHFKDYSLSIQSKELQQIAKYLLNMHVEVGYYGKAWGNYHANWMYFEEVLDLEALRFKFSLGEHIKVHENLDNKSGLERGFIDTTTGEGLMGKVKDF